MTGAGRTDRPARFRGIAERRRGVSEVVGIVVLIGLVVTAAMLVVVVGGPAVDEGERRASLAHAESSMRALDDRAAVAGSGGSPAAIDPGLGGRGGTLHRSTGGWMRVNLTTHGRTTVVANRTLGAVAYEHGDAVVAYQGGGVFRADDGNAVLLSTPDVDYVDGTLSVTLVSLDGDEGLSGSIHVSHGATRRHFPEPRSATGPGIDDDGDGTTLDDVTNPLWTAQVSVTVHSRYYEAWGAYFEQELPGRVRYDHRRETVTVVLRSLQPPIGTAGIIATARSGNLSLAGTGAYTDSYDSAEGSYAETVGSQGTVEAAGDVYVSGDATLLGDVRAGRAVTLEGTAQVDGDVGWTTDYDGSGDANVAGEIERIDGVEAVPPVDGVVENTVDRLARSNDNDETPAITDEQLSISGSSAELGAGAYYLEEFDLQGEELVLNTTEGDVEIAVRDWMRVVRDGPADGEIRVVGDGDVRFFVAGREEVTVSPTGLGSRRVNLHVGKGSSVRVPNHDASRLHLFAPRSFNGTVAGSSGSRVVFDGVIYAPAGRDGPGWVYVKQGDVFGAVVTGDLTVGQYGAIHFDRSIAAGGRETGPSEIDFLHVLVRELLVED